MTSSYNKQKSNLKINRPQVKSHIQPGKSRMNFSKKAVSQKTRRGRVAHDATMSQTSSGETISPSSSGATTSQTSSGAKTSQISRATNVWDVSWSKGSHVPTQTPHHKYCTKECTGLHKSDTTTPSSQVISDSASFGLDSNSYCSSTTGSELLFIPERRTDKTFIFLYDEKEKKSKEVILPKDIRVKLPVLVQYEITEETLRQTTKSGLVGNTKMEPNVSDDTAHVVTDARYVMPTLELIDLEAEDEMKNKGARIMKWLMEVQSE